MSDDPDGLIGSRVKSTAEAGGLLTSTPDVMISERPDAAVATDPSRPLRSPAT